MIEVTPVVLMGYANPIEAMGYGRFAARAKECGMDGVLTVDYPPEESGEWAKHLERQQIDAIFLLSPTTPQARIERVAQLAQGYVYYVSLKGVTGVAQSGPSRCCKQTDAVAFAHFHSHRRRFWHTRWCNGQGGGAARRCGGGRQPHRRGNRKIPKGGSPGKCISRGEKPA